MKRILCSLLLATLPFGSALADEPKGKNAKVTLVYEHELPNVPGKSLRGCSSSTGRAADRPPIGILRRHSSMRACWRERSAAK